MDASGSLALAAISAVVGVSSHLLWFTHGEHDFSTLRYLALWMCVHVAAYHALTRVGEETSVQALSNIGVASISYVCSVFTSILVYRLFFHRLNRFPGPLSWRLTKFAQLYKNRDFLGFKHIDDLHRQYGKVVRTGPSDISIIDPAAPQIVLGPASKCRKPLWYGMAKPLVSLQQCRDKKAHDFRRQAWNRGFSPKSLRDYEGRLTKYADKLLERLAAPGGESVNATEWLHYFSFDLMGDLGFGESFGTLESGKNHPVIQHIDAGLTYMNVAVAAPWFFYLMALKPSILGPVLKFNNWSYEQVEKRRAMEVSEPDIISHILDAPPMSSDPATNKEWLSGDARLIAIAGSDTTAVTVTFTIRQLILHPEILENLRREVSPFVYDDGTVDHAGLQKCQYLLAVIDETLRLYPPTPSGLSRLAPPEGITIGNTFIPGDTNINLPFYSMFRDPEAFERPDEFIPERWTSKLELVKDRHVFVPFSTGPFGCVGKNLAYMTARNVLARLVCKFDIAFAKGEDGSALVEKSTDHFAIKLADLWITCKPRQDQFLPR